MKDKFDMFNDMRIDEDKFDEVILTKEEKDNIKSRMRKSVSKKKVANKKLVAIASVGIIVLGGIVFSSETTWAYIENIGRQIEMFLRKDTEEFKGFKVSVNQDVMNGGMKLTLKELMLDDGQMILSLNLDTKDFDYSKLGKGFNNKNTSIDLNTPTIIINNMVYPGTTSSFDYINNKDGSQDILIKSALDMIDTNNDGHPDKEHPILDNINTELDYDVRIIFNDFTYRKVGIGDKELVGDTNITSQGIQLEEDSKVLEENLNENSSNKDSIMWEFRANINGAKIMENIDVYTLNKEIIVDYKGYDGTLIIESVRVSPVSAKIKYRYNSNVNMYEKGHQSPPTLEVFDENGNFIGGSGSGSGDGYSMQFIKEADLQGNEKAIVMKISVDDKDKTKYIEHSDVRIELNR